MSDYSLTINFDAPLASLQRALHSTIENVAVALRAIEHGEACSDTSLPVFFKMEFSGFPTLTQEQSRLQCRLWLLRAGFRDCFEALHLYLDEIYKIHALLNLNTKDIVVEDFNLVMDHSQAFHRLGFPQKIEALVVDFDAPITEETFDRLTSINAARNCLTHRGGRITDADLYDGALHVEWTRLALFVADKDGNRITEIDRPNVLLQPQQQLLYARLDSYRDFSLNENIEFNVKEFNEILSFIAAVANEVTAHLKNRITSAGLKVIPPT